ASSVEASTIVYGKPVTDRATGNAAGNLIINNTQVITQAGVVTKLEAWAETLGDGNAYAVLFSPSGVVTGIQLMKFTALGSASFITGLNFTDLGGTGSNLVYAGYKIGLFQPTGGAGISVDNSGLPPNPSASDFWAGIASTTPVVGSSYTFNTFASPRDYSFQVTVSDVPAPPTLWLLGSTLAGWAFSRRNSAS
ncbi:MAG: PEP-CTERM sorting domain-containing protein, partial [Candidatus Methylumidiphilus sp.]